MLVLIHRDRSRSRRPARAGEDRRRSRAAIAGAAVLPAAALLTVSAPAARAAVPVHGYVWADQPSTPGCYTPNELYQANSTGALNAICHAAGQPGVYTVSFPGLGAAGGIVNVTAYAGWRRGDHVPAQLRRTCMAERWYPVQHWNPVQSSEDAIVRCFDGHTPADARFAATFSQPPTPWTGPGDFAYVYANQPATATYTPMLATQYNSRGGVNTITHDGSGDYVVRLPGLGPLAEGTVKVTYAQSGNGTCNVVRWRPEGHDQLVHVRCFTATGAPTDAFFTLTYANHVSVLGDPGLRYGYVWANQP